MSLERQLHVYKLTPLARDLQMELFDDVTNVFNHYLSEAVLVPAKDVVVVPWDVIFRTPPDYLVTVLQLPWEPKPWIWIEQELVVNEPGLDPGFTIHNESDADVLVRAGTNLVTIGITVSFYIF